MCTLNYLYSNAHQVHHNTAAVPEGNSSQKRWDLKWHEVSGKTEEINENIQTCLKTMLVHPTKA